MARDLTIEAREGYEAAPGSKNPYIFSSPASIGWDFGHWAKNDGRSCPISVRASTGYSIRAEFMRNAPQRYRWNEGASFTFLQ